ncbi:transposase [Pontibacillus halophilus]|uniref:transposase n=1 Tax=Pontibacillus halophilus TaxID=516704 RepID=UPI0012B5467A
MRQEKVERSFGDSTDLHGLRYCRSGGKENVHKQALLTAARQNMTKPLLHLSRIGEGRENTRRLVRKNGRSETPQCGYSRGGSGVRPRKASGILLPNPHKKSLQKNTRFLYKHRS